MAINDALEEAPQIVASMDTSQVAYLNAILESYEGLAVLRTLDPGQGIVCFYTTDALLKTTYDLLLSLQKEIGLRFLQLPSKAEK